VSGVCKLTSVEKPRSKINITLGDNRVEIGTAWETTPSLIARQISKSLFERVVIAKVDGQLWDLERPLENDCKLELLDFENPEGWLNGLQYSSQY
jgi:threonyl-tRNA synthetase